MGFIIKISDHSVAIYLLVENSLLESKRTVEVSPFDWQGTCQFCAIKRGLKRPPAKYFRRTSGPFLAPLRIPAGESGQSQTLNNVDKLGLLLKEFMIHNRLICYLSSSLKLINYFYVLNKWPSSSLDLLSMLCGLFWKSSNSKENKVSW